MRTYRHDVDEKMMARRLDRKKTRGLAAVDRTLAEKSPDLDYHLGVALHSYHQALCTAWALEDDVTVTLARVKLTELATTTMARFPPAELQIAIASYLFSIFAHGHDRSVVEQMAEVLRGRPHQDPPGRTSFPYVHPLTDALTALVLGDDERARSASVATHNALSDPATPPGEHAEGLPHAVDAVARRDEAALAEAAEHTIDLFARYHAPTDEQRSGYNSLIHSELSAICRVARWRGMTPPQSPYILPMDL